MAHLRSNLEQSSPLQGIGDDSITRQPGSEYLDLEFEEVDMGVPSGPVSTKTKLPAAARPWASR